jgi:hypothetical protein
MTGVCVFVWRALRGGLTQGAGRPAASDNGATADDHRAGAAGRRAACQEWCVGEHVSGARSRPGREGQRAEKGRSPGSSTHDSVSPHGRPRERGAPHCKRHPPAPGPQPVCGPAARQPARGYLRHGHHDRQLPGVIVCACVGVCVGVGVRVGVCLCG